MKKANKFLNIKFILPVLAIAMLFYSCDIGKYELPEAGSFADETPPAASFSYAQGAEDAFLTYSFANLSASAVNYSWDFGDGNTSTDKDGQNTYASVGMYTVTLTASDALGASDTYSETIEIIEPEEPAAFLPEIMEAGFEDGALEGGTGDGRDSWRCDFGTIMQITSSPVFSGGQAAKFPGDATDARVAYQELQVSANAEYKVDFHYTMKTDNPGSITVRIMGSSISELPANDDNVLGMFVGTDQTDADSYEPGSITFETGATETIAILITNEGVECRLDEVTIQVVE